MAADRPKYLNLFKIHLPVTGMVSLAHRASGFALFVSVLFCVGLLERSLASEQSYAEALALLQQPVAKLLTFVVLWALAHHFFAGIRFLLIDVDIGVEKSASRTGAWLVFGAELLVMAVLLGAML